MNRLSQTTLALLAVLLTLLAGCSKQDKVINVADDDPEMLAAIAKARDTLPQFWKVFDKPERGESGFALKVKITDPHGTEYFWATGLERRDSKIMGTIDNDPDIVRNVKLGQRIEIPEADISDWLYMRGSNLIGNETLKPLLKKMPAREAAQYRSIMAAP